MQNVKNGNWVFSRILIADGSFLPHCNSIRRSNFDCPPAPAPGTYNSLVVNGNVDIDRVTLNVNFFPGNGTGVTVNSGTASLTNTTVNLGTPPGFVVPTPLSPVNDLTDSANAAIGTYSATIPLFYADMNTLVERMGELRLTTFETPATTQPYQPGNAKEGKEVAAPPSPPTFSGISFLYAEYDYATGDKIRQPSAIDLGLRWQW